MKEDELRKKCFDLECALGKAIKIGEMQQEELNKAIVVNGKLSRIVSTLTLSIRSYIDTMDKRHLVNALDTTSDILR